MPRRDIILVVAIFLFSLIFVPLAIRSRWHDSDRRPGPPQRPIPSGVAEGSSSGQGLTPATGPEMAYQRAPLTSVAQILDHPNPAALTTQTVELNGVRVETVLSPIYLMVGPDSSHRVVVRLKEAHPEIKPGQTLNVSGVIQQLGDDLSLWQINPRDKVLVSQHPIFINAISVQVNS